MIDSAIQDILLGVVGNGLWAVVSQSTTKAFRQVGKLVSPPSSGELAALKEALDSLKTSQSPGHQIDQRVLAFLRAPETEAIVRQVFATTLVGSKESTATLDSIRREFLTSMSKYLDLTESHAEPFANSFYDAIVSRTQDALKTAIEKNVLSAHEAQSAARNRKLLDEIANVQKNITFLTSKASLDVGSILQFENKYRDIVASVHGYIKPPHLESGRRVPIDEIFVPSQLSWVPRTKGSELPSLSLSEFLPRIHRTVLVGHPGGGKSTTSSKICYDLSARYSERLFAGREITPAIVVLREYGSQKKIANCSIVQFLEQQASSRYQLKTPHDAFDYLLLNGRLMVIFDGLDELLDTSYRQEITSNVESFCRLYPSVPVLVTSREVGYEQAPLDEKMFEQYRLAPFSEEQVRDYAVKWFARDEDYTPEQKSQKANAFFLDSAFVPDLRSNPLMLGLMCNLYRVEGYIPRNRPEVYGKCSVMLFERWDKSRDILVPLPFEEHIRPAMQDLAYWIYGDESLQGGVTEHDLVERTTDYLCKWVFDDPHKARFAACDFIRFCTGRAWVFTDTGTTREGEKLFQFTHRTFLEYFAACYLVSIHPTPESLLGALKGRIAKREWDVVAQLAIQIQSKQVHGAADQLIMLLFADNSPGRAEIQNTVSFAERSLEFLVPSPPVRREVARKAMSFWLQGARELLDSPHRVERDSSRRVERDVDREIVEHVGNLLLATSENRDTIADEIRSFLKDAIGSPDERTSRLAAQMILDLPHPMHRLESRRGGGSEASKYWAAVSKSLTEETLEKILALAKVDPVLALRCYWHDLIGLSSAVRRFGIPFLVVGRRSPALGNVNFYPPGHWLVDVSLGFGRRRVETERDKRSQDLASLADFFLQTPAPWLNTREVQDTLPPPWIPGYWSGFDERRYEPIALSPDGDFALLCLLAMDLERTASRKETENLNIVLNRHDVIPAKLKAVLLGRLSEPTLWRNDEAIEPLNQFDFSPVQRELLGRWIIGEISFVASRRTASKVRRRGESKKQVSSR